MATETAVAATTEARSDRFVFRRRDIPGLLSAILILVAVVLSFTAQYWLPVDPNPS